MKLSISTTINGQPQEVTVRPNQTLLEFLRDDLALRGSVEGCGVGVCGSCTVLENGKALRSCQIPASEAKGRSFITIEGLSADASHPCQRAWLEEDVAQCGFCQPGMILTVCELLRDHPNPTDEEIDTAMSDSVCRCGTYPRMRKAIRRAATLLQEKKP